MFHLGYLGEIERYQHICSEGGESGEKTRNKKKIQQNVDKSSPQKAEGAKKKRKGQGGEFTEKRGPLRKGKYKLFYRNSVKGGGSKVCHAKRKRLEKWHKEKK